MGKKKKEKKIVVVLGPHRSGTSLCAAAIESLGANLSIKKNYSNNENLKGFFENQQIVDFNDRLLAHLGGSWDNPAFCYKTQVLSKKLIRWNNEAKTILSNVCGDSHFVAIKDPRFCQLVLFWLPVIKSLGYKKNNIYFVHSLRNPIDVAKSQRIRSQNNPLYYNFGKTLPEGLSLWVSLTKQALSIDYSCRNYIISYKSLIENTDLELKKLANFLGITTSLKKKKIDTFCRQFVDKKLNRSVLVKCRKPGGKAACAINQIYKSLFYFGEGGAATVHHYAVVSCSTKRMG